MECLLKAAIILQFSGSREQKTSDKAHFFPWLMTLFNFTLNLECTSVCRGVVRYGYFNDFVGCEEGAFIKNAPLLLFNRLSLFPLPLWNRGLALLVNW